MPAIFMALTDAQKLNQTRQTAASLQQAKDSTPGRRQGDIAAKLTAYDSGTGYYSWTEQAFDEDGVRYDKPEGLSGTTTYMPALALASAGLYPITTFPTQVWLRPVIVSGSLGQVWEILGGVVEVELVEKICVTKTSGVVTDLTIQKGVYQLWGQRVAAADCSTGDTNCCPVSSSCITSRCGAGATWSRTLTLTISGSGTALDGVSITMTYTDVLILNPDCPPDAWCGSYQCDPTYFLRFSFDCLSGVKVYCVSTFATPLGVSTTFTIDDCDPLLVSGVNTWINHTPPLPGCPIYCPTWTTFNWAITE